MSDISFGHVVYLKIKDCEHNESLELRTIDNATKVTKRSLWGSINAMTS